MDETIENTLASKFTLCVLPTQWGKTYNAISKIKKDISQDNEHGTSIHIIFTMNSLLNNEQFAKRLDDVEKEFGEGSVCVINSSKKPCKYKHVSNTLELMGLCAIKYDRPRVVVMCSNKLRYSDGVEFLKKLNENLNENVLIKRAFVYYDELHKYINDSVRKQIEKIHNLEIVNGIMAMTATPDKIWEPEGNGFWSKLKIIYLDNFSGANYAGYNDMIFNCVDDFSINTILHKYDEKDRQIIGFIEFVLKRYPEILENNTMSFIPGNIRRVSHNIIRDLIFSINNKAVVIVINGLDKSIKYNDDRGNCKTLPLQSYDEEVCETISRLVLHHKLENRPVVITGLLCVGMGQTLLHKSLGSFTSAIFGHLELKNDDMYQLIGRIFGRTKDWGDKYVQTQVYCPTTIMYRIKAMEECARNMACCHNGEEVCQEQYREPMNEMDECKNVKNNFRNPKKKNNENKTYDTDKEIRTFDTQDEAIEFGKTIKNYFRKRCDSKAPNELQENGNNPSEDYLLKRFWGISEKNTARMVPTIDGKWCVYWRPSLIKND